MVSAEVFERARGAGGVARRRGRRTTSLTHPPFLARRSAGDGGIVKSCAGIFELSEGLRRAGRSNTGCEALERDGISRGALFQQGQLRCSHSRSPPRRAAAALLRPLGARRRRRLVGRAPPRAIPGVPHRRRDCGHAAQLGNQPSLELRELHTGGSSDASRPRVHAGGVRRPAPAEPAARAPRRRRAPARAAADRGAAATREMLGDRPPPRSRKGCRRASTRWRGRPTSA